MGGDRKTSSELHCSGDGGYDSEASGYYITSIPKPVIDHLGEGGGAEATTYKIRGARVEIGAATNE